MPSPVNRTAKLSLTALTAALALAFSVLKLEAPFPVLPYLKFDLAEVPVTLGFLLCGLPYGVAAETVHFLGLVARGADPLGAFMKFLAVVSMFLGAYRFSSAVTRLALGVAARVAAMTLANYAYFYLLFPGFLGYALKYTGSVYALFAYTALFNVIHGAATMAFSMLVVREVKKRVRI